MLHRLFLGLAMDGWTSRIKSLQNQLKNHLRDNIDEIDWQRLDALHMTLVFIGEVNNEIFLEIQKIISNYIIQNPFNSFFLTAEKVFLLNHKHIVINASSPELFKLQHNLENILAAKKIIHPERNFHAHITIGKIKRRNKILEDNIISEIEKINLDNWKNLNIENIILFESFPKKEYTPIMTLKLS